MPIRPSPLSWRRAPLIPCLAALLLLVGCAAQGPSRRQYEQSGDSATNGCLRNPECYMQVGNEAPLPWLSQTMNAARTTVAVLRLLEAAELTRVEQLLVECAKDAHFEVDEEVLGKGKRPTREQCNQVVRREQGRDVTLAMELGNKKHERALECVRKKLGLLFPENVSVTPHYKQDPAGRWRLLDPAWVAQWLRDGLFNLLLGALAPDVVVHASGNPHKAQKVYDFKFPCLPITQPQWRRYPEGHPHAGKNQGDMYGEALNLSDQEVFFVSPQLGISR